MEKEAAKKGKSVKDITKDREVLCNHVVETSLVEMRLVFDCKECPMKKADLKQKECLNGVLKALTENFNADNVVLRDYVELRYSGPSMKMLKSLVELSNEMGNLSMRNPVREYFNDIKGQSAKEKRRGTCQACNVNPQNTFPRLKKLLLEDIERFYEEFGNVSRNVRQMRTPECKGCVKTTEEALVYMFNLIEEFRAFLYYEGFRVVI